MSSISSPRSRALRNQGKKAPKQDARARVAVANRGRRTQKGADDAQRVFRNDEEQETPTTNGRTRRVGRVARMSEERRQEPAHEVAQPPRHPFDRAADGIERISEKLDRVVSALNQDDPSEVERLTAELESRDAKIAELEDLVAQQRGEIAELTAQAQPEAPVQQDAQEQG